MAAAIALAFCVAQPALAVTQGPIITVAAKRVWPEVAIAISNQGNFAVGWLAQNPRNFDNFGSAMVSPYAADGSAIGSAPIALGSESRVTPAVAMDADSDLVAAWVETRAHQSSFGTTQPGNLYLQRYSADGSASGARTQVSSIDDYHLQYALTVWGSTSAAPQLAIDDSGDLDVAWNNFSYVGSCNFYGSCGAVSGTSKIYAAAYRADGTALRGKTTVDETTLSATTRIESLMGLSKFGTGDVGVTAYGYPGTPLSLQLLSPTLVKRGAKLSLGDFSSVGVVATASYGSGNIAVLATSYPFSCTVSRFDTTGAAIGAPIVVPLVTSIADSAACSNASLVVNASGAFAVVWAEGVGSAHGGSYTDIYGQYFNADGSTSGATFAIRQNGDVIDLAAAINTSGQLAVTWSERLNRVYSIYARSISPQ